MKMQVEIPDELADKLMLKLGFNTPKELITEALTILDWASTQCINGRIVASADKNGNDVRLIETKGLVNAASFIKRMSSNE